MADEAQGTLLTEADKAAETTSWFSEENAEVVKRCGWAGPNDAIQSFRNVEKMSSGMVKMTTPESSAEEIRAFYMKTGCPENPEGYEIAVPEGLGSIRDEGIEGAIKQIAYDQGVSKQAFESIVKGYYEKIQTDMVQSMEAGELALKQELGDKYDEEVTIAKRFTETCSDEFKELLETSGLGNNPVFIKEFIAKGKQTMGDTLIKGEVHGDPEKGFVPSNPNSPEMYANGEDEESKKSRNWFEVNKGYIYQK